MRGQTNCSDQRSRTAVRGPSSSRATGAVGGGSPHVAVAYSYGFETQLLTRSKAIPLAMSASRIADQTASKQRYL